MDLSQQELPLTSYFTRSSKETISRAVPNKKGKSVARPSKRRSNAAGSTSHSKLRPTTLQLPTPATSARKRKRSGHLEELQGKKQSTSLSSVENVILSREDDLAEPEPNPLKLPESSRDGAEDAVPRLSRVPLATPSTSRRKPAKPIGLELPVRSPKHTMAGTVTPQKLKRKPASVHDIDDDSVVHTNYPNSTQPSPRLLDFGISQSVLPRVEHISSSTAGFPVHEQDDVFVGGGDLFASKQKLPDGPVIPMIPIPSSQSQYLLHLDATPKRKRCSRPTECVNSSQTQEERELVLSTPCKPAALVSSSTGSSGGCARAGFQIPLSRGERTQHVQTLGSTPVGSPIGNAAGPSHSSGAKMPSDEIQCGSSPSRCEGLSSYHSLRTKTPRKCRHDSIEDIPNIEDSLTEPESEPDALPLRTRSKLSTFGLPSQDVNHLPRHSPVVRDACSQGILPSAEDDSATEAESDTEILHCVAEISKKRSRAYCPEASRKDTPPPPVISPLVSPARSRIAVIPSIIGCTQFLKQGGVESSTSGSCVSTPTSMEQLNMPSESLPSVVRDFIRMFPGDESYPADFPASLRV